MYGCDCHIGCLSGEAFRIGRSLEGLVSRIGGGLSGNVVRMGTEKPSQGLSGYVSMVCTSNRDSYLTVSTDVVWLSSDMLGEEFEIYSNVVWKIE